jgi:protein-S-isoprenylcysteine O-methyltransferase Ste14
MDTSKIKPPTYLLIAILLEVSLYFLFPIMVLVPSPWTLLGIFPLVAGLAVNLQADRAFHRAGTAVNPFEPSSALVTSGPYRWTRNPMYLGFVLILIGAAILSGSLSPYIIVAAFTLLLDVKFIRREEQKLATIFGIQWEIYSHKTHRWL